MASVNCFGDDRYEDVQLFYCQLPANESICELLQQMYDVKEARALLVAIPLTLSFLAAILNGSFGAMTILFCARNKVDHQHALLLSETLSVLVAQALFYSTLLAIKFNYEFGYTFVALCLCVASMTFFVHSGSYFANTSLLFLAIVRPLKHRNALSMKQTVILLLVIWLASIVLALCIGLSTATVFFPLAAPLECTLEHCQWPLGFAIVSIFAIFYMVVIALYMVMLWHMNLRRCNAQSDDRDRVLWESSVRAMKRLTLQVIAFTLSGAPILAVSSFTLAHLDQIELLGLENASPCAFIVKGKLIGQAERLVCINVSAWILPMISVPLISCYVDSNIHELIRHKFGLRSATTLVDHQSKLTK